MADDPYRFAEAEADEFDDFTDGAPRRIRGGLLLTPERVRHGGGHDDARRQTANGGGDGGGVWRCVDATHPPNCTR